MNENYRRIVMTVPATALPFGNKLPSADDRQVANQLRRILASQTNGEATLKIPDPETKRPVEITLTPQMSDIFLQLLRHIGSGNAVTLVPTHEMLTTQQAADLLNVSRPYFIKLLDNEDINHTMVGRHRRVKAKDVFAYKATREKQRSNALDELLTSDSDLY